MLAARYLQRTEAKFHPSTVLALCVHQLRDTQQSEIQKSYSLATPNWDKSPANNVEGDSIAHIRFYFRKDKVRVITLKHT